MRKEIGLGLMGLGVVGSGVERTLREKSEAISALAGSSLSVKKILIQNPSKRRIPEVLPLLTTEPRDILDNPQIEVVIELMGGEGPAYEYIREALSKGKHVVTANKEVIAKHGLELLRLAAERRVGLLFEASVGGGIPLINPFRQDLLANRISALYAIINGTTNYIVTQMAQEGMDFAAALEEARRLGYVEPDPTNDIEGVDAAYKLAILATLAFQTEVHPEEVYREGISRLNARDFRYANELGYTIKPVAIAKLEGEALEVRVHPLLLPQEVLLAQVNGVYNAVQVEGDLIGKVVFYGEGAGALPTSSAIIADVLRLARNINLGLPPAPQILPNQTFRIKSMAEIQTKYYLRMAVLDRAGVLAQIAQVFGDHQISLASVIQKESDRATQTAEIVLMTHICRESAMQQALAEIAKLPVVREVGNLIRVEE
ncbi:MAG: homoserine dehydrogenase [Chloroflexi bacterium]|nr:MAG: homoserine dehydrogenase [Chloroflexota bacterium]